MVNLRVIDNKIVVCTLQMGKNLTVCYCYKL